MAQVEGKVEHAWNLMKQIQVGMLVTHNGHGDHLRARPMAAHMSPDENAIYFLADAETTKDHEIEENSNVCVAFSDPKGQRFVSVTGQAQVANDRTKIKELWSVAAKAYWDSADDPSIRILRVTPENAEYWESFGKLVSLVKMGVAQISGRPNLGANEKVSL
jgi:general stress protein 26